MAGLTSAHGAIFTVNMNDFFFDPTSETINVGDTITWIDVADSHLVASGTNGVPDGLWDSGNVDPGGSFSFTFNAAGTYPYFCAYHYTFGMVGSITVLPGNAPPSVSITHPTNGETFTPGSNVSIQASASDSDGTVVRVDFFSNGSAVGSATNSPYAATINNIAAGQYDLSAIAVDNQGATATSSVVRVTVQAGNLPPSVNITNPVNGQAFFAGTNVLIQAGASDPDGIVSQVEFFANNNPVGLSTNQPFELVLSNLAVGSYSLTARAADNLGATSMAPAIPISVVIPTALPTILTPPQSQTAVIGSAVTLFVTAAGPPPLTYVWQFDGTNLPSATNDTLVFPTVRTNDAGNYVVSVGNGAGSVASQVAVVTVVPPTNLPPVVAILSPASGTRYPANSAVTVVANAFDPDGTIVRVEFLMGTTSVGTLTNSPFSLTIGNVPAGGYVLTARATDDLGGSTTSAPVSISVVAPPTVSLVQPAPGGVFPIGGSVRIVAAVGTTDNVITNITFFAGSTNIGLATSAPFSLTWIPHAAGPVLLTAVAEDDLGQTGTSPPVGIRTFIPETTRPTLTITNAPANFARLTASPILLAGVAHDNIGLDRVEFQNNGGPFQPATGTAAWRADIALTPGKNAVGVRSVDLAGNISLETFRYFSYVVDAPVVVQVNGTGSVIPPLNGRLLEIGRFYQITARAGFGQLFSGWEGTPNAASTPRLVFQMTSNLVLTASFVPNPFLAVAGTYLGLMMDTNGVFPANSALVMFQVGQSGLYTGKIMMNGARYPFHGRFSVPGHSMFAVLRPGLEPIALMLQLDLSGTSNQILGACTDGTWTAPLLANRMRLGSGYGPAPQSQPRVLVLQRTPEDGGATVGTGAATISRGGSVSIRGVLSQGHRFNLATALSQNGDAPFYLSSGHGAEIIIGWLNLPPQPPASVTGDLIWSKSEADGFSARLLVIP